MSNLFSGLEDLGLDKLSGMKIYDESSKKSGSETAKFEKPKIIEEDLLFDKTYTCPVCDKEFKSKMVKTGKVKLLSADTDLRPVYQVVDSLKYDAIACPYCGYAALNRFFNYMTSAQAKFIREQVSSNFKGLSEESPSYSYDDALTRHKLALVSTVVKKGKTSERAYTCLKIAWLLRGKAENLPEDTPDIENVKKSLKHEEDDIIAKAYEGFVSAFSKELFPMCGIDEITMKYLVADLARRIGKNEDALRWLSSVLVSKDSNERIKQKARDLKDMIKS